MWFELGHRIVWYRHSYEYFGGEFWSVHKGHQMIEAVGPNRLF